MDLEEDGIGLPLVNIPAFIRDQYEQNTEYISECSQ
jgi:hypothetical protein